MPSQGYIFLWWLIFISMSCLTHQTPMISSVSLEQIKDIGETAKLICIVDNLNGFSVSWSKNNPTGPVFLAMKESLALPDNRFNVYLIENEEKSQTHYTLEINNLESSDTGIYECQVITSLSNIIKKEISLRIRHPPIIIENDTWNSHIVTEGKEIEFGCVAEGYPRPIISWKRENDKIMPFGGHTYQGNSIRLSSAHREDRGIYYCIANNSIGEPAQKSITLEVEFAPEVHTPKPKVAQAKFYSIEMECKVEAYPAPIVEWYRNGQPVMSSGNYRVTNIAEAHEITTSVLRITNVGEHDYGDYFCNATNKMGNSYKRLVLFRSSTPDINFPALIWVNSANHLNCNQLILFLIFLYSTHIYLRLY